MKPASPAADTPPRTDLPGADSPGADSPLGALPPADRGTVRLLTVLVAAALGMLLVYSLLVGVRGIQRESIFFNLVELVPLGMMVLVFWISRLARPRKSDNP